MLIVFKFDTYNSTYEACGYTQRSHLRISDGFCFGLFGKQLHLKIFTVSNGSGSAKLSESDEISHDLILSITQYDEHPETKVLRSDLLLIQKLVSMWTMGSLSS